jgi:uncharacterized protein CbrC (UPF0167 family)
MALRLTVAWGHFHVGAMMSDDKPFFRFHPGAYERGAFIASRAACDVCERPSVWLYDSSIYIAGAKPAVCARCVADGKLTEFLDGEHGMHDAEFGGEVDDELADEVMQRTPGFSTFNGFEWPVLGGKPMVFVGHGDEGDTWENPAAAAAIRKLYEDEGDPVDGTTPYAIVFKELDGSRHVAIMDLD